MLRHRLWLVLLIVAVLTGALQPGCLRSASRAPEVRGRVAARAAGRIEASSLRRWTLARARRWRNLGVVVATISRRPSGASSTPGCMRDAPSDARGSPPTAADRRSSSPAAIDRAVSRSRRRGHDAGRDRRLRLGQSAFGRQGVRARRARIRLRSADRGDATIPKRCARADRVVLPGVGAFADCRRGLDAVPGMVEALNETVRRNGRPFLGICVGMQLMAERGREYEVVDGPRLDPRRGRPHHAGRSGAEDPAHGLEHAERTRPAPAARRHPRSGRDGLHGYFVHSYHLKPTDEPTWWRKPTMAAPVTAMVARDNYGRHAISPGEEPAARACADRQLPEVEAVNVWAFGR